MPDGVVLTYSYNGIGQINTLTSNHGDIVDALAYSPLSQVKTIDYANDVISIMTYDPAQMYRMTDKLTEDNTHTTTFQDIAYTYDNVGNITDLVESSGSSANKTAVYVYDDLYRLISATITNTTSGSNYTRTFTFDSIGNILTKSDQGTYTYGEPSKVNPHAVTLIDDGAGTTKTFTYDDNGNLTVQVIADGVTTITKTLSWDHLNRMTETEVDDGTDIITVTYTYDQGGRRLKKVVDDGTTAETTRYPFSDYEVTVSGSTKTTVSADTQHVATIEDDGLSTLIYFHHDDHLGGANVVTSVVGALVQVIDYFPFGSVRVDDKSSSYDSTQKFTGHELDDDTGLYYAQARYYDSEIGRFISQDPLQMRLQELMKKFATVPQAFNYYAYSANNPIVLTDPTGESIFGYIGGNVTMKYLESKNYNITAQFFGYALKELSLNSFFINDFKNTAPGLSFDNNSAVAQAIKYTEAYQKEVMNVITANIENGVLSAEKQPVTFSSEAANTDLYYAINKADFSYNATEQNDGSFIVNIQINDVYDFTEVKNPFSADETAAGAIANNIATAANVLGELKTFNVQVNLTEKVERGKVAD